MTETKSKNGFRQFPITLKFVVIWTGVLGLIYFFYFVFRAFTALNINIYYFMLSFIYFTLASGLNIRQNGSRILMSALVGIGTMVRFIILALMLYSGLSFDFTYKSVKYDLPQMPVTVLLVLNIVFNTIILYILLRPSTKALFSPPPAPSPETSSQEAI